MWKIPIKWDGSCKSQKVIIIYYDHLILKSNLNFIQVVYKKTKFKTRFKKKSKNHNYQINKPHKKKIFSYLKFKGP